MVIFRELDFYDFGLARLHADHLIFETGDERAAAENDCIILSGAAFELYAVNAAAEIDNALIAVFDSSVADRLPASCVFEILFDLCFDLFVGNFGALLFKVDAGVRAQRNGRAQLNGRGVLKRAVAYSRNVDIGSVDREKIAFLVHDLAVSLRQNYIQRVFEKYADAVHVLNDLAGNLTFAEALDLELALVLFVSFGKSVLPLFLAYLYGKFYAVFFKKFFCVVHFYILSLIVFDNFTQ